MGHRLLFDFKENEFFTNSTLSKTYTYEVGETSIFYGEVIEDVIDWRPGMMLPPLTAGGVDEQATPSDSFFDFFDPPQLPPPDHPEREVVEMKLMLDYEYGEIFKSNLIPDAVDWFTGKAVDDSETAVE
ncbi:hypothetical protein DL764_003979 [Monosporascus ibericus]|uniref:Uncharacterized protein n=1 Tax=Monosporascus ibericus TaxID=155417 RepID=A0A4V1XB68_9PEZI|nr:hypothetical protein DL764_003979 [Monosporascus ibericus]